MFDINNDWTAAGANSVSITDTDTEQRLVRVFDDFSVRTLPLPLFRKLTSISDDDVTEAECNCVFSLTVDAGWPMRGAEPTDDDWQVHRALAH